MIMSIIIVLGSILLIKNIVTYRNHNTICNAIQSYRDDIRNNHDWLSGNAPKYYVHYNDMESYYKTFFRLLDWSYKRILPKDKFAIIEPYIEHS